MLVWSLESGVWSLLLVSLSWKPVLVLFDYWTGYFCLLNSLILWLCWFENCILHFASLSAHMKNRAHIKPAEKWGYFGHLDITSLTYLKSLTWCGREKKKNKKEFLTVSKKNGEGMRTSSLTNPIVLLTLALLSTVFFFVIFLQDKTDSSSISSSRNPDSMARRTFILWLHGLGDSGPANEPIKTVFKSPEFRNTKWLFPSAPSNPVSCNCTIHL